MARRARRTSLVVVCGALAFAAVTFVVLWSAGGGELPGTDRFRFDAVLRSTESLAPGGQVRQAGVVIGRIDRTDIRGGRAVVSVELDEDAGPVYRDASVGVRAKSLIGEKYLELDPGTARRGGLPRDGVLPLANSDEAVQLDQVLSTFDAPTRRALRVVIDEMGRGLGRREADLNGTLGTLSSAIDESAPVASILASQRNRVASFVEDFGQVSRSLGDRASAIGLLARQLRRTANAVASRDRALAQTLDELPSTLDQARTSSTRLGVLARSATPVVVGLDRSLRALAPALASLGPAAQALDRSLIALRRAAPGAIALVNRLRPASRSVVAALPPVDRVLAQSNPLVGYLARYDRELGAFFANLRSGTETYDALGNYGRIHLIASPSSLAIQGPEMRRALDALIAAGGLSKTVRGGNNPYPSPGESGQPKPFSGAYHKTEALPPLQPTRSNR